MKKRKLSPLIAISRVMPLVMKQAPILVIFYGIFTLLVAIQAGLAIPVNQFFYDAIINAVSGQGEMPQAITGAVYVVCIILAGQILGTVNGFIWTHLGDKVEYGLFSAFDKKIAKLPAQKFEDATFLDEIEKAQSGIYGTIGMFATVFEIFLYFGGYFVITGAFLWHVQPVLVLILIIIFIPTALIIILQSKMYAEEADELTPLKRRADSFYGAAVNPRETRLYGVFNYFYALVLNVQKEIFTCKWKTEKKNSVIHLVLNLCRTLGWCGTVLLMIIELLHGNITVGVFVAVYSSMGGMMGYCEQLLSRIKVDISENLGMIEDYIDFLNIPLNQTSNNEIDLSKGICAQNIFFRYPGTERNAVDGVCLTISPEETVAIVGENGSGKTTLAKLLCGLYRPDSGNISLGGVDSCITLDHTLFSKSTAVFQNYVRYTSLSLEDNVRISKADRKDNIEKYLDLADANYIANLSCGYRTIMSREFDGVELSGGQWQRIAMARGLYRPHELIILDEPTAAIDPLEETRIYKMFAEYAKGKICILVTHRLGSAKIADRILVMDSGRIIESGSHEELLEIGGRYAEMWNASAEGYK